jgi:hypothetical protein
MANAVFFFRRIFEHKKSSNFQKEGYATMVTLPTLVIKNSAIAISSSFCSMVVQTLENDFL